LRDETIERGRGPLGLERGFGAAPWTFIISARFVISPIGVRRRHVGAATAIGLIAGIVC